MKTARMRNPLMVLPTAMPALKGLADISTQGGVPAATMALVSLRASQINESPVCIDMHTRAALELHPEERLAALPRWREADCFNSAERAALALTEATTLLNDRPDPVSDEVWIEATRHYDELALATLVFSIGMVNFGNRINLATGQVSTDCSCSDQ